MRIVSLLEAILSLFVTSAQKGKKEDQQQKQQKIPTTLADGLDTDVGQVVLRKFGHPQSLRL